MPRAKIYTRAELEGMIRLTKQEIKSFEAKVRARKGALRESAQRSLDEARKDLRLLEAKRKKTKN